MRKADLGPVDGAIARSLDDGEDVVVARVEDHAVDRALYALQGGMDAAAGGFVSRQMALFGRGDRGHTRTLRLSKRAAVAIFLTAVLSAWAGLDAGSGRARGGVWCVVWW